MKHQPAKLVVKDLEEFERMVTSQDFVLAKSIVEGILANIDTDEPEARLLAITVKSESAVYDVTVPREDFAETLEQNLAHYVKEEQYEECRRIVDTIEQLNRGKLSKIVTSLESRV